MILKKELGKEIEITWHEYGLRSLFIDDRLALNNAKHSNDWSNETCICRKEWKKRKYHETSKVVQSVKRFKHKI